MPLYPPMELMHAFGFSPLVLWGARGLLRATPRADERIQPYVCSVARRLAEFVLSGNGEQLQGLFFMNGCDTLRNLPEILQDGLAARGRSLPLLRLHVPATSARGAFAADYLERQVSELIAALENLAGRPFDQDAFARSTALYREARALARACDRLVAQGRLLFMRLALALCSAQFQSVETQISELRRIRDRARDADPDPRPLPVIFSGIEPPPAEFFTALVQAGLQAAGNDIALMARTYMSEPDVPGDASPGAYYAALYEQHTPCPTLLHTADRRAHALLQLARERGAKGVVFLGEKFCEYEYLEFPHLEKRLRQEGFHTLQLEFSAEDTDCAAQTTRAQAFAEMLEAEQR